MESIVKNNFELGAVALQVTKKTLENLFISYVFLTKVDDVI